MSLTEFLDKLFSVKKTNREVEKPYKTLEKPWPKSIIGIIDVRVPDREDSNAIFELEKKGILGQHILESDGRLIDPAKYDVERGEYELPIRAVKIYPSRAYKDKYGDVNYPIKMGGRTGVLRRGKDPHFFFSKKGVGTIF